MRNAIYWIEYYGFLYRNLSLLRLFNAYLSMYLGHEARWHSGGQRFDPAYLHQKDQVHVCVPDLFYVDATAAMR